MKLKAATLIESLVAMVILVVCLGIGTMIYSNVINSDQQLLKLKANLLLEKEVIEIKKEKRFIDGEKQIGEWIMESRFEKYSGTENLSVLSLSIKDESGKLISMHNELIRTE
ncbi:MAG: hypothetical protein ACXVEB_14005 [Bacteroidia bacterium]